MVKKIFKYRKINWKWFGLYLFPRDNYGLGIGFWPDSDGDYPLLYIKLIFIELDITFAPNSWFNPDKEEQDRIDRIMNMSEEDKEEKMKEHLRDVFFGGNK